MNMSAIVFTFITIGLVAIPSEAQLDCEDDGAQKFNGQEMTVCATMVGGIYLHRTHRQPTLLYFERPFFDHVFAAVIYGEDREKFGEPEKTYLNKMTCVKGVLNLSGDRVEIVVKEPSQLTEKKDT